MGGHQNPEDGLSRRIEAAGKPRWPEGATAGLLLVAAACIGLAALLYHVAGPRDVFPA